jgi:large subunit ribosomal protein L17
MTGAGYELKRDTDQRVGLLRNLVTSVIEQERIVTTEPKAKAAKPLVEKTITLAKRDTLHARGQAAAFLRTQDSVRLGPRQGEGAEQVMLELIGSELVKPAADRAKRREERLKPMQQGKEEGGEEQS